MKSALTRLAALIAACAITVFLTWGYLRENGLTKAIKEPLTTPFLTAVAPKTLDLVIYHPFGEPTADYYTLERVKNLAAQASQDAIWLDVHPRSDGTLILGFRPEDTSASASLKEALRATGERRLILSMSGYRPGVLDEFARVIDEAKAVSRVLIQSPEDGFMKDAREAQPTWLFGTSQTQVTLMIMLSSLGIEMQAPLRGDVYVMEGDAGPQPLMRLSDAIITEVHRRARKVYAGPVTEAQLPSLRARGVDGALVTPTKAP